jgi:hypothetical protein
VSTFRLDGTTLYVLDRAAKLKRFVSLPSPQTAETTTPLFTGIVSFTAKSGRVAALNTFSTLYLSELSSTKTVANVRGFSVNEERAAYLTQANDLYVAAGPLRNETTFEHVAGGVRSFAITLDRVVYLDVSNNLRAKEGKLDGNWELLFTGAISSIDAAGPRISMRLSNGDLYVKEGTLKATFEPVAGNVVSSVFSPVAPYPD